VSRPLIVVLLPLLLACGTPSGAPAPTERATSATDAVRNFMRAVADSNIDRMARYWGTASGPAGVVHQPSDYEQRLVVTQAFLRRTPYRVLGTEPWGSGANRQLVRVELDRTDPDGRACTKVVPFGAVQTGEGWVVANIDLTLAGTPGRSCVDSPRPPN
jgi:hypothetical protein